jgi:hypothetical protein
MRCGRGLTDNWGLVPHGLLSEIQLDAKLEPRIRIQDAEYPAFGRRFQHVKNKVLAVDPKLVWESEGFASSEAWSMSILRSEAGYSVCRAPAYYNPCTGRSLSLCVYPSETTTSVFSGIPKQLL